MGNKKKVYVVTTGSYSDYSVSAIYSDRDSADVATGLLSDSNDVQEWILDEVPADDIRGRIRYLVVMAKDGLTEKIRTYQYSLDSSHSIGSSPTTGKPSLYNYCWAMNEEHAVKITNDIRVRLIAQDEWKYQNE